MSGQEQKSSELLDRLQEFCSSNGMEEDFEKFAKDHVEVFISSLNLDSKGVEEHPLEYHTVYRKYLAQFEAKIEAFIEKVSFACHMTCSRSNLNSFPNVITIILHLLHPDCSLRRIFLVIM